MTKARYQATISLSEEDQEKVEKIQKKGIKIIEIFRKGLEVLSKEA